MNFFIYFVNLWQPIKYVFVRLWLVFFDRLRILNNRIMNTNENSINKECKLMQKVIDSIFSYNV